MILESSLIVLIVGIGYQQVDISITPPFVTSYPFAVFLGVNPCPRWKTITLKEARAINSFSKSSLMLALFPHSHSATNGIFQ